MTQPAAATVLFTGYAPFHFVCFRPIFDRLARLPEFDVFVSGGLRTKTDSGYDYDGPGLYAPFDVPEKHVLSVDEIRARDFDVVMAANTKMILPRIFKTRIQLFHGFPSETGPYVPRT